MTLKRGTQLARVILKEAKALLPESVPRQGVRLIGVGLLNLQQAGRGEQISLFEEGALGPGSLLE
ncbi:MAG: hypothetical protein U5O15_00060 [Candidatus Krumholzibacteriota bacterium]|nr:hypothetical protein [Candidatus Krumholzibacteriota bacterium]